jgi:PAS domain S-box-containing protein
MKPLQVSQDKSFTSASEENYYRVILLLFSLAYLFSFYYPAFTIREFVIPWNIFAILPLLLIAATYLFKPARDYIKEVSIGFFLLATLHLTGMYAVNGFNTFLEFAIIALVIFTIFHLNRILYLVIYNVLVLTTLEFAFMNSTVPEGKQPVVFFFFLLTVMVICIFYQVYRIRFRTNVSERENLLKSLVAGNPDSWILFEGPGLVARDASSKALSMFAIADNRQLNQVSLHNFISGTSQKDADDIIRNIIASDTTSFQAACRDLSGNSFWADISTFRIEGKELLVHCRFVDITEEREAREMATATALSYRSYLDNTAEGIVIAGSDALIRLVNKTAAKLLNKPANESFTGKNLSEFFGTSLSEEMLNAFNVTNGTVFFEKNILNENGIKLSVTCSKISDIIEDQPEIRIIIQTTGSDKIQSAFTPVTPDEDFVNALFRNSNISIAVVRSNGQFIRINESFTKLTEYDSGDMIHLFLESITHPVDVQKIRKFQENLTSSVCEDIRLITKNGSTVWVNISSALLTVKEGANQYLLLFENITESRNTELELINANSNVNAVIENTDTPILSIDFNHKITVMNSAFEAQCIKRYGRAMTKGEDYRIFMSAEARKKWNEIFQKVMRDNIVKDDETVVYTDGRTEYFEVSHYPVRSSDNIITGVSVLSRNVTERINFEKELVKAKEVAESATQAKSGFLATMSHEIRTPLNGLIGMSELLRTTKLSDKQREYIDSIRLSGEALLSIINDVLDFSRIESDKMELENKPFELRKCIEDTFDILYYRALEKQNELLYHIEPSVPQYIYGDRARLRQVLVNLVGNAIKFTTKGQITVTVIRSSENEEGMSLRFSVKDTGVGIAPEKIDRLFKAFSQADTSTFRKYGGTGLGLAISSRLVSLMNGKIWVESKPGEGSTFYFTLKTSQASAEPIRYRKSGMDVMQGRKILLISNNDFSKSKITSYTLEWKAEVKSVSGNEEINKELESVKYDLIVADFQDKSAGLEKTALKIRKSYPGIPVIAINYPEEFAENENRFDIFDATVPDIPAPAKLIDIFSRLLDQSQTVSREREKPESSTTIPGLRILVAEDNLINQTLTKTILQKLGYHPDMAADGTEAVAKAVASDYDIIFMDIQMPVMDGIEATREIEKLRKNTSRPVIIAMTAFAMEGDREKFLEAGMDDYISKPIRMEDVKQLIIKWGNPKHSKEFFPDVVLIDTDMTSRLTAVADGDPSFVKNLIDLFISQSDPLVEEIIAELQNDDTVKLSQAAHKLKGSSLNLGAKRLGEFCKVIEVKASRNELDDLKNMGDLFRKVYKESVQALIDFS